MADPSTIGGMVSRVFAEATLQVEATKDAFKALKKSLSCRAAFDVYALERNPGSAARRAVIAEAVDTLPEDEKISVKTLAIELAEVLGTNAGYGPVGIDVRRVTAEPTALERIDARESPPRKVLAHGSH